MPAVARPSNFPPPIKGWNTRDPIGSMHPLYAQTLDNLFPRDTDVELRTGAVYASLVPNDEVIKALLDYNDDAGSTLFAFTDNDAYDVGALSGVAQSVAITNGYVQGVNFQNSAGTQFLWVCNGVDAPIHFNGTVWATPVITGVTATKLCAPWVNARRIFAVEKDSMNAWCLPVDSIAGAAVKIDLGSLFDRGGFLMAGGRWTLDGGDGQDDYTAFITNMGEVAVYRGIDPEVAANWVLVGVYQIAPPMGRRCMVQAGGDLLILTRTGVFPLSRALKSAVINYRDSVSDTIAPSFLDAVDLYGDNVGWEMTLYPDRDALIVNIPTSGSTAVQYVMNTKTGAWCSFSGWPAYTFRVWDNQLYFATTDTLMRAWGSDTWGYKFSDNDPLLQVVGTCLSAYRAFTNGTSVVTLLRPIVSSHSVPELQWGIATDFGAAEITSVFNSGETDPLSGAGWNPAVIQRLKNWHSVSCEPGRQHALLLKIASKYDSVQWSGCDALATPGGLM